MRTRACIPALILGLALGGCAVGPDYVPEAAPVSKTFKELKGWRLATPSDALNRGDWWAFYRDPKLSFLIKQVEISNQTVAAQAAAYEQARALIREAQAALFPVLSATYNATRAYNGPGTGGAGSHRHRRGEGRIFVDLRSAAFRHLGSRCLGQGAATNRKQLFRRPGQLRRPRQCKAFGAGRARNRLFQPARGRCAARPARSHRRGIQEDALRRAKSVQSRLLSHGRGRRHGRSTSFHYRSVGHQRQRAARAIRARHRHIGWPAARRAVDRAASAQRQHSAEFPSRFHLHCSSGVPTSPPRNEQCRSKMR